MSILNANDDAKAIKPVLDAEIATLVAAVVQQFIPAAKEALTSALSELKVTITIDITKK